MNRRQFLRKAGSGAAGLGVNFWASTVAGAAEADAELLASARERIARLRRGPGRVRVVRPDGRPVVGAAVRCDQVRHEFLFGCNAFLVGRAGDPAAEAAYRERFAALFNYATLGFYWASFEAEKGRPDHARLDRVVEWAASHRITCKGHPLVWDHPAGSPRWLPDDDDALRQRVEERVRDIVGRFTGRLDIWDVVNEATHLPDRANRTRMSRWGEAIGNTAYARRPLELARAANPKATLLINDYRTDSAYHRLLERLRPNTPFDAVGIQSHMHDGVWPISRIQDMCDRYADLGRPLHFTEATIPSGPRRGPGENWGPTTPELEATQAAEVERLYTILFAHPAVGGVTWWDFSDRQAWQGAAAGVVRSDMTPKPAYDRLKALIRDQWWTRAEGVTNAAGEWVMDAFFGAQKISVGFPGGANVTKEVAWRHDSENHVELVLT